MRKLTAGGLEDQGGGKRSGKEKQGKETNLSSFFQGGLGGLPVLLGTAWAADFT